MRTGATAGTIRDMMVQHLGLRAQIVLGLVTLMVVVFGFTSVALLWVVRTSLDMQQRENGLAAARVVVRGIAQQLRANASPDEASQAFDSVIETSGITAIGLYDARGEPVVQRSLSERPIDLEGIDPRRPRPYQLERVASGGHEMVLVEPLGGGRGSVVALVSLEASSVDLRRLAQPLLIYLFTSGLLLLGFGYVAFTTLIVRPLEDLTRATEQVALGRLDVKVPVKGGREIASAASAFNTMTTRLREQKASLEAQLEELERTAAELGSTQHQLVRSARLASVGSLAAGVAHEVGNPVSAIIGLAEVLIEGDTDDDERREYIERIRREAERVNRIIRDLLEYARAKPGQEDLPGSAVVAIDAAVGLLRPQKTFREIDVQVMTDGDLPLVNVGTDQLTQVLVNILLNAADAMAGSGEIRVRAELLEAGRQVQLSVSDTGPGIPEGDLERIFEPFYTTKDPGSGTGLGLALCEGIVTRAGGAIHAVNSKHGGLTVIITLPLVKVDDGV